MSLSRHPGKTPAQQRVLDAIGCGNHSPHMMNATRDKLLREGLIVEVPPRMLPSALGPIRIRQFDMPTNIHIQWCEAMSAQEEAE